jgi:hypothetical protein
MRFLRCTSTAAIFAALLACATAAAAQNNICVDLEARLVALDRGGQNNRNDGRQYDVPIAQQKNEIDRATAEARRAGCMGGFLIFQPRPEAKCGKLMATINKMQGNLQRLMSQRSQFDNDPYNIARQRSAVLQSLAENRCGPSYASNDGGFDPPRGGLFASLFGPRIRTFDEDEAPYPQGNSGFGTYRTLCVRTCDGFYFPISFSTVPGQFQADAATCQAMCPGTETVLYTHRNPGEDTDQMVSLAGEPYTSLPNAYKFRTSYDKACTCGAVAAAGTENFSDFSATGTLTPLAGATPQTASVPLPTLRPAAGEDPETIANRAGGFTPRPVTPSDGGADQSVLSADGSKKIRVVGPAYYYGQ